MNYQEHTLSFNCGEDVLFGIVSMPDRPVRRGVVIVVGGPQYRAGSHRQFTLLARALAQNGFPVLRFDYRGMGDSTGAPRDFERVDDDLRAAIDRFFDAAAIDNVVIWGLCDGASAALFYAEQDARVSGVVMLNPWARSASGLAKTTLKHYYVARLLDPALWKKVALLRFDYSAAAKSFAALILAAFGRSQGEVPASAALEQNSGRPPFQTRMCTGWSRFDGKVLLIISGADLTAREFLDLADSSRQWRKLLAAPAVKRHTLTAADHTCSRREWRDQVAVWTTQWLVSW
jgi:exosortase A-associated hydrolase 1